MAVSVDEVFDRIIEESVDKRQQGTKWERAVQWFLTQDPAWKDQFDHVWMWDDAPTNPGRQDTGIDLVAQDMDGEYWAIQAKCYSTRCRTRTWPRSSWRRWQTHATGISSSRTQRPR